MDELPGWMMGTVKAAMWMLPTIAITVFSMIDLTHFHGRFLSVSLLLSPVLVIASIFIPLVAGVVEKSPGIAFVAGLIWVALALCQLVVIGPGGFLSV
ncbi:hypothetical protein [Symmachiella dynata]|uniref:hypothetical protein n=1 Tax=Symmachiella dynata TaxID=2527995 RepID=UPI0030EF2C95